MRLRSALMLIAGLLATAPSQAADNSVVGERLLVGKTNIFCVQAPCPWRGIAAADNLQAGPADLLWSGQNLPPLDASDDIADRLSQAWESGQCLMIDGRMERGKLLVDRIVGECP